MPNISLAVGLGKASPLKRPLNKKKLMKIINLKLIRTNDTSQS
jgi:hypothetical protein